MASNELPHSAPSVDPVFSPLRRLQADLSRDREFPFTAARPEPTAPPLLDSDLAARRESTGFDNESVYSFDSVSTSGRLLDRLDLDAEDYSEPDAWLRRRESAVLMQSAGRSWDLPLDELAHGLSVDLRQVPIRASSTLGLDRIRSLKKQAPARTLSAQGRLPVQGGPAGVIQQKRAGSFDSVHADITSRHNSASSLTDAGPFQTTPARLSLLRSQQRLAASSPIPESASEFSSPVRTASATFPSISQLRTPESQTLSPFSAERKLSASSIGSSGSAESTALSFSVVARFDPSIDAATKKALAVRAQGNHREASYQLQTLANAPYNYPKAMYLYAKALRLGQGVKLNEVHSVKWLCRCILTSYIAESSSPASPAFANYVSKLANLLPEVLLEMVKINLAGEKYDPFALMDNFAAHNQTVIHKIQQLNASDKNIIGGAYFLLGDSLVRGQGVLLKDEPTGRLLLAKSASLGYADGMARLGELWCSKSKQFKKDYHIASAWLRLGVLFGKEDIGNSWIYKTKYMEQKKK